MAVFSSCVKSLESAGVMKWDLSSLDLPQMEYNGKTYYIHPDAGEMSYEEALAYCERLTAYNHSDWFLPGQQELAQMFRESSHIGGFTYGAYWYENSYTNSDTERYLSYQGGSLTASGKGRVRPVRCENSFSPTVTLKQVNDGNWSTFEVSVTQSSRYTISKSGLCWSNKANSSSRTTVTESNAKDGTFLVSIEKALPRLENMYLSAFSELSDGTKIFSNEITLIPHKPIVDFSLVRKDDKTVTAIIDVKDWGFPELFEYTDVRLSDRPSALSSDRKLDIKESVYHYEQEWNMQSGTLYLHFNPFQRSDTNVNAVFSASIDKETKAPQVKVLPVTNKTALGLDENTNVVYSMTLNFELLGLGFPEATSCGVLLSQSSEPSLDNSDYCFTNKDAYVDFLEEHKKFSFDNVRVTPNEKVFVRAFAISESGTTYSDVLAVPFIKPELSKVSVSNITSTSANFTCTVSNAGDPQYTERGFIYYAWKWLTESDTLLSLYEKFKHKSPVPNNNITGSWSMYVSDLTGNSNYSVLSYVVEGNVIWFSEIEDFTSQ